MGDAREPLCTSASDSNGLLLAEAHSQGKPGWVLGMRVDYPAEMFQKEHTVSESFENDCVLLKKQRNPPQVVKYSELRPGEVRGVPSLGNSKVSYTYCFKTQHYQDRRQL